MVSIIGSILSMKVDIYRQIDSQDPDTGAILKYWEYYNTLDCHAKGIVSNSSNSRSKDTQSFNNKYRNEQTLQIRTVEKLSIRDKITNIRNRDGNPIWTELDTPNNTPTVFELTGIRSENQIIGL
jgi:hypothetical protein